MVYKVLDCRDFITLLLFYTIGGHHREILHLLCGSCLWHSFIAAHTAGGRFKHPPLEVLFSTKISINGYGYLVCTKLLNWPFVWVGVMVLFCAVSHSPFPVPILRAHFLPLSIYNQFTTYIFFLCLSLSWGPFFLYNNM